MSKRSSKALQRVEAICAALPESVATRRGDHADFRVRKKVYAYFLDNHHGDGIVSVCCKAPLGEHEDRARREPARFYLPAYIGARGWFGIHVDRGEPDWIEIGQLLRRSYSMTAPKTLARLLEQPSQTG